MSIFLVQYPELEQSTDVRAESYIIAQTKHLDEPEGYREGFRTFWTEVKAR